MSEYAYSLGVELVPQQEALGHSGSILVHKQLHHLRESGGVFCSSKPEVFAFLGDLFDELVEAFPRARFIHVGGDEFTRGFAKCPKCKARADEIGKAGLYAEHLMRLREMLATRGRKMMIWWNEKGLTDEAADRLAKDIVVFDWHYGNRRSYPSLARLQKLGFEHTWATPAVTRYYARTNDFDNTFGNIRGFLAEGAERGVPGQCTCTWVHGLWGGRNLFELNFYALVYSAQCAWQPAAADEDAFRRRFARHWFGLSGDDLAEEVMQAWHAPFGPTKEQGFWRNSRDAEPRLAEAPATTIAAIEKDPTLTDQAWALRTRCRWARQVLESWRKRATRNRKTIDFLLHDVHIYDTLAKRVLLLDRLRRSYPAFGARAPRSQNVSVSDWSSLIDAVTKLELAYTTMERTFDRSVREAGGGRCGWGPWFPFVSKGGIRFRAKKGRDGLEELRQRLLDLRPAK